MTNEEILKKAIDKAIKNGCTRLEDIKNSLIEAEGKGLKVFAYSNWHYIIIFSHDFAKAFWGEEKQSILVCPIEHCLQNYENSKHQQIQYCPEHGKKLKEQERPIWDQKWKDHLSTMVLEEDPIKYLEKFL